MIEKILLSGYTKRKSIGIYSVLLDTEEEKLSDLKEMARVGGPTYMALDAHGHLYTVAAGAGKVGGTAAFNFDGEKITPLNEVFTLGASNAYVAVDEKRSLVYGANYHEGEIRVYKREKDGTIELVDTVKHKDEHGPKPEQTGALVHYTNLTPDNKLVVCDLGNDSVTVYDVAESGKLADFSEYKSAPGSGDRHLTFSPDGKTAYMACELDSTVEVLDYKDGQFSLLQKISTLPKDYKDFNGLAAIRLSSDGKFLYVSNRGHNSLTVFKVKAGGRSIELMNIVKTEGDIPRDFNFAGDEHFIIVAHQDSDNLTLFKRNQNTGKLTLLQKNFFAPEITCVLPVK
ncbi:MAG: lactonase family protein [Streptococcaceae bacterium]|jgi:6-phosphogluconolactonase|nr:lactonase family protein [Streptococcaceae bacterium]